MAKRLTYDQIKRSIRAMLADEKKSAAKIEKDNPTSERFFDYALDLSDEHLTAIRWHGGFLTGAPLHGYAQLPPKFDKTAHLRRMGYQTCVAGLPDDLLIGEPAQQGVPREWLGVETDGRIVNPDIVRYQQVLANLHGTGVLDYLADAKSRPIVVEAGGRYGGLALHLSKATAHRRRCVYVLFDRPERLFYAATHLLNTDPDANIYLYQKATFSRQTGLKSLLKHDYVLLPDSVLEEVAGLDKVQLFISAGSFQEMAVERVEAYLSFARRHCVGYIYSDNLDRLPCGPEDSPAHLSDLLRKYATLVPEADLYQSAPIKKIYDDKAGQDATLAFFGRSSDIEEPIGIKGMIKLLGGRIRVSVEKEDF